MIDKLIESKKIKIFTIMTTGRTGSDYLASCLDGVNGVIVFSGKFDHTYFFKDSIERKNQKTLIYNFLKKKKKKFLFKIFKKKKKICYHMIKLKT